MRLGHAVVADRPPRSAHSAPDPSMPDSGIVPGSRPVECIATPCFSWSRRLALLMPSAIRPRWSAGGSVRRRPSWDGLVQSENPGSSRVLQRRPVMATDQSMLQAVLDRAVIW
jgi:hypothetical protein